MSRQSAIAYYEKHKRDRAYLDAHNERRKEARKRKRGGTGPLKPLSMSDAMKSPTRKIKNTCADCPLWKPCYCPIIVATRIARHPACRYGIQQINNELAKKWHRENYSRQNGKEVIEMGKCCGGKKGCKGGGKKGK